ncbi:magnesium/cobalt transporter CorA [Chitinophaga pinensis]|uniref:Magnesium transport protein CorA n=1 Tax=Chitinophaga pinensis (strain ATCC 43595 / DSM 2588 / LMG 13176 / NBRC 15968 / NCIMB 11800 / UQM 2034) TaxID=485918 RepID=A0A979GMC7_CHIPD|nr:magnesium/cobalt transporter CorA [Chitinophaga pinensis]ACU58237.1 magnesium and cobalt transport protein CorA [Chitinophaga pinensis DSM 2588]
MPRSNRIIPIQPIQDVLETLNPFKARKQRLMNYNPVTGPLTRKPSVCEKITIFNYSNTYFEEVTLAGNQVDEIFKHIDSKNTVWINVDGINKETVHRICIELGIHILLEDDIMSVGQRAKMDEIGDHLFCLLPMMYFNAENCTVDQEQVSIVLGKNFVISFQEEVEKDVFNHVREKLRINNSRMRSVGADYLCYSLIDTIVDSYYLIIEKLGERIELMEDAVQHQANTRAQARINFLRKELLLFKRAIAPVRELVNGFLKSDSDLLEERTTKYFKDVYDHIIQANDLAENYRDMILNVQDLYHTQINLKMNEIMKVLAVVTTIMAPLTFIAGIYGMNFDNMPELHTRNGYYYTMGFMLVMLIGMILLFKKKRWF